MKKPVIGILGNLMIMEGGFFPGIEKAYVNHDYVEAVIKAGGIPVIIPVHTQKEIIKGQIQQVDGIIISGGYDVNPIMYGQEPQEKLGFVFPSVDHFDLAAIHCAMEMKKPILGICRGMQILNVFFGGSLYQDLSYIPNCFIKHMQESKRNEGTHHVEILSGSKLYELLGKKITTNSFHHQALKDVASEFVATAKSNDHVVEAIEKVGESFVIGVQWHPEMMIEDDGRMLQIFKALIQACTK